MVVDHFCGKTKGNFGKLMLEEDSKASDRLSPAVAGARIEPGRSPNLGQTKLPPEQTIDLAHLARMTCGEKSLEAEVLSLFDRQAGMLLARMVLTQGRRRPRPHHCRLGARHWRMESGRGR